MGLSDPLRAPELINSHSESGGDKNNKGATHTVPSPGLATSFVSCPLRVLYFVP